MAAKVIGEMAERLKQIPPYPFQKLAQQRRVLVEQGADIINWGIGDPDLPTYLDILVAMWRAATDIADPNRHRYGGDIPVLELPQEIANYYRGRFGVELNPETEVLVLIGSKEGIAHLPLGVVNPGETVIVPDPGYPPYGVGPILAGGIPYPLPLRRENGFLLDLTDVSALILNQTKLLWVNYPNNPTTAVASLEYFTVLLSQAARFGILVAHDLAYGEVTFDGYKAPSILQVSGAKEVAIEFGSFSKTFNMTGWRLGYAVGNANAIAALRKVKDNVDSGVPRPIQWMGVAALQGPEDWILENNDVYRERQTLVVETLNALGWDITPPQATFYVWAPTPNGVGSEAFATQLLEQAQVMVTPGKGFGDHGEGFFRISLTNPRIAEGVERLKRVLS